MKYVLIFSACLLGICATGQVKGRAVAAELQLFKEEGAVIVSSDTELVRLVQTYIDFGEIYTPEEVGTQNFKGLYISEYTAMGMAYTDNRSSYDVVTFGSDYYLLASPEPAIPGERGRALRNSQGSVGVPISNTLREKLPLFLITFNNLLHLSHKANQDISVFPVDASMEKIIGNKVLELKNLELLVMEHELNKGFVKNPDKLAGSYPYSYAVTDLFAGIRAVKERKPGQALVFTNSSQSFWAVYVLRCDTHELLYGWSYRQYGRELNAADFVRIATAVKNAGG